MSTENFDFGLGNGELIDNSNGIPDLGTSDQYFNYVPMDSSIGVQPQVDQNQIPFYNQSISVDTNNTIPAGTFDDDFLALLNEDLTFTDMAKSYQAFEPVVETTNLMMNNNGFAVTSDLAELKTIDHSELVDEFQSGIHLLAGESFISFCWFFI